MTEQPPDPDIVDGHLLTDDVMLADVREEEGEDNWCQDNLYSFKQRKPLRKPCGGGDTFKVVRNSPYFLWTANDRSVLVDARTGKGIMRLASETGYISYLSGETDGFLLMKITGVPAPEFGGDKGPTAIVRCSLAGECELASDVYEPEPGTERSLIELPE